MKKKICNAVFMMYKYAIMTKKIHYSTDQMSTHELCDKVMDSIIECADSVAEACFGKFGKPSVSEMTVKIAVDEVDSIDSICGKVTEIAQALRKDLKNEENLEGVVSTLEDFISEQQQFIFLSTMK